YVEVLAANPQANNAVGAYYLGIDFGTQAVVLQSDIDTTLNDTDRQELDTLTLSESQLTHFVLSATGVITTDTAVRMTIYDDAGDPHSRRSPAVVESSEGGYDVRVAHFDCFSGISGDMTLGALIDAGVDAAAIQEANDSLGLPIQFEIEKVLKGGFVATYVHVEAPDEETHRFLPDVEAIIN